jgi:hypothetical protein
MDVAEGARPAYTVSRTGRWVSCPNLPPIQQLPMTATQLQLDREISNREISELVERHGQMMDALLNDTNRIKVYGQKKANEEGQYELCLG